MVLKRGGNNFGIVTCFDVATFKMADSGAVVSPTTKNVTSQALKALSDFTKGNHEDENAAVDVVFSYGTSTGDKTVGTHLMYAKEIANRDVLKPSTAIQPQISNNLKFTTVSVLVDEVSEASPSGYR